MVVTSTAHCNWILQASYTVSSTTKTNQRISGAPQFCDRFLTNFMSWSHVNITFHFSSWGWRGLLETFFSKFLWWVRIGCPRVCPDTFWILTDAETLYLQNSHKKSLELEHQNTDSRIKEKGIHPRDQYSLSILTKMLLLTTLWVTSFLALKGGFSYSN